MLFAQSRALHCILSLTLLAPAAVPLPCGAAQGNPADPLAPAGTGLRVRPAQPRQGDALFVRLDSATAEDAKVRWAGREWPLHRVGDRWVGAVPVSTDARPGGYTLRVSYTQNGEPRGESRKIELGRTAYPVQHLHMAPSTARLYNYPGVESEERAIGKAIRADSPEPLWSGDWLLPCPARLSTRFGEQRIRNGKPVGRHRGLDLAAKKGTPVQAAAAGRVALTGRFKKHGNTVVIDHGLGITSMYLHLSAIRVREGEEVRRGQVVGAVGSTGVSTGPHLHWSVYVFGEPVEPLLFCRLTKRGAGF